MAIFFHDTVLPKDPDGFSIWRMEHYLEHRQFIELGQAASPPFVIPDYDISTIVFDDPNLLTQWMGYHASIHDALRQFSKVDSAIDLSEGDLNNDEFWFVWMDNHASEHRAIRQALNLT